MTNVLCLPPLFGSLVKEWLSSYTITAGRSRVMVSCPNQWPITGHNPNVDADTSMRNLDAKMHEQTGTFEVAAYSYGTEVVLKWMRELGPTSSIDPADVKFILAGCPEMKFTGESYLWPATACAAIYPGEIAHTTGCPTPPEFHGGYGVGYGLPAVCPWDVTFFTAQYDGHADAPKDSANAEMVKTIWTPVGLQKIWDTSVICASKQVSSDPAGLGPHGSYNIRSLTDPTNVTYTDPDQPTVDYIWSRTYPIVGLFNDKWNRGYCRDQDAKRRPTVEAAYTYDSGTKRGRPVTIPAPSYASLLSWSKWKG